MQAGKLKRRKMTEPLACVVCFPEDLSLIRQSLLFQLVWLMLEMLKPLPTFLSFGEVLLLLRPALFRFTGGWQHHRRWQCLHVVLESLLFDSPRLRGQVHRAYDDTVLRKLAGHRAYWHTPPPLQPQSQVKWQPQRELWANEWKN